jgi:hypothetical protein
MAQQFDPNTGQWSDSGGSDSPVNTGRGGSDVPAPGGDIPPQTGAPPPITANTPMPGNVNPDYWKSLQGAMVSSPAVTGPQTQAQTATNAAQTSATGNYPSSLSGWQSYSNPTDQGAIHAYAQWLSSQPGADPLIASQVDYLAQRIQDTGGLTSGNVGYWSTRTQQGNWTAPENSSSAGSSTTPTSVQIPPGPYAGLTPPSSPISDAGNAAILKLLQTPQTVDAQTVAEAPEAVAERLQSQRGAERQIAASAEQAAQSGESGTGGQEGMSRQILANEGEQDALFSGTLASTMRQQQIQQLEAGIQYAQQSGQFDKAQQLQAQLAQLSAGLNLDQLGLGYASLNANNNNAALQILMNGGA